MDKIIKRNPKWMKKVCDLLNSDKFLYVYVGFGACLFVVLIGWLISILVYGYPENWPMEFPWNYILK